MASPRVFVSSTCYDLKYIRENIKYFVKTLGYEPVLSEDGAVFFNPEEHTHDSCLSEVPNCQMFVLIIGGRYGGLFQGKDSSITNEEYREAIRKKIPVFALVEQSVYSDHHVYTTNKKNPHIDETKIQYPSSDNIKIFEFIDEVRSKSVNNAIVPFRDFFDIELYLKQQWAGMMHSFLVARNEESRVADMMSHLVSMNERIEYMSSEIVNSVGSPEAKVYVELYEVMSASFSVKSLYDIGLQPSPISYLENATLAECAQALGQEFIPTTNCEFTISSSGEVEAFHFENLSEDYANVRSNMLSIIENSGLSVEAIKAYKKK
ncbi:DUF4062 domain-containing protein [Vibrio parahaemolyticus]|uniref:DUF4062 domain-containing protein n=1 Tax=Vibrio parahaemolyticus TaxID=670 RepID=UPI000A395789|nr:DUF4062 domain-containing protein [Vibrio parahaemolyticus]MDF5662611.1 DUF4062 domain-containing protein [Vibrio parahaemolyticus]MEA5357853.1 DUF4062 domain-containing protein [Vibrio parahaemolyticus]OUJ27099.1 hypothetical protein BTR13_23695 [Vibrio parahaemolyticus]